MPSTLDGDTVMERVRADGMQVALVADEYGGTAGIVTMEDLIEEIIGDVRDEHDEPQPDAHPLGDGWSCSGLLRIDEVERLTGYRAPDGDYETIAGSSSPNSVASPRSTTKSRSLRATTTTPRGSPGSSRWTVTASTGSS